MSDQTLFDHTQNPIDPEKDYTEELVGEGKKFSDVKELARGKVESDRHIETLQRELSELREDLNKRVQIGDLLEELKGLRKTNESDDEMSNSGNTNSDENKNTITSEDIERLVSNKLSEAENIKRRDNNYKQVKESITKAWGKDASAKLEQASRDLGMTPAEIDEFAKERPVAFIKALGLDRQERGGGTNFATSSQTNSSRFESKSTGAKTQSYYQEMRKTDPKRYHSKAIQVERMNEAIRQGEAFFDA